MVCGVAVAPALAAAAVLSTPCEDASAVDAATQDRALRLAARVRAELDAGAAPVALVARAGIDLRRFGQRYSHAGFAVRLEAGGPWVVRQLYLDCATRRPALFDQGLAAFVLGADGPRVGWLSVTVPVAGDASALASTVRDNEQASRLLGPRYSANAHAFSVRHQNCNQWAAELMAVAWGARPEEREGVVPGAPGAQAAPGASGASSAAPAAAWRRSAQQWLEQAKYEPVAFDVGWPPLRALSLFMPWVREDDHPAHDLEAGRYRVSMPASLEALLRQRGVAWRLEVCHTTRHAVLRRDGPALDPACTPAPGDTVLRFDEAQAPQADAGSGRVPR
ncbi:MAG: hypothetical protein RI988_386 [Pseudomonadota bacterium]|jgi:hypothetical protein